MDLNSFSYLRDVRVDFLHGRSDEEKLKLRERLSSMSSLSPEFLVLLLISTVIATLGLYQNSAAVIIGAMIVAPLMKPLMGLSYGSLIANGRLVRKSLITVVIGTIISVAVAFALSCLLHSIDISKEITSRTHPNLLDLGVAFFAGAAGAYCQTKKELSDSLAGVAIAVALVPPLGVVGIGLSLGQTGIWHGAGLLYATNLVGITFAGIIVFIITGFGPIRKAHRSLGWSSLLVIALMIPLALSMRELLLESSLEKQVKLVLNEKTETFRGVQLQRVEVKRFQTPIAVTATVLASGRQISSKQVGLVQEFLRKEIGQELDFRLQVIPSTVVTAIEVTSGGQARRMVPLGTPLDGRNLEWSQQGEIESDLGDDTTGKRQLDAPMESDSIKSDSSPPSWEELFHDAEKSARSKKRQSAIEESR